MSVEQTVEVAPQVLAAAGKPKPESPAGLWLQRHLPALVMSPSLIAIGIFVYGFIVWTFYLSFTRSKILLVYAWAGT